MLVHDILDGAAERWGARPAVVTAAGTVAYADLARRSRNVAAWLHGRGVRRGDRVMLCVDPSAELATLVYACSRLGAPFVVVGTDTPPNPLELLIADCEPALLITVDDAHRELAHRLGLAHAGPADVEAAAATPASPSRATVLTVDPACLIYTSGSTTTPKAVVSPHGQVVFAATQIQKRLLYTETDRVVAALPMSFDYGLYQLFLCALAGAELHLGHERAAGNQQLVRVLSSLEITVLPAVPLLAHLLGELLRRGSAEEQTRRAASLASLRLLTSTGAAMPAALLEPLRSRLPGMRVQIMYGLTECKRVSIMPHDEDLARPEASGLPLDGTEVYAIDESGRRLPPGEPGELVVRGPHVMLGYWRAPEASASRFPVGGDLVRELRTGDLGYVCPDGFVHCRGRMDDVFKQNGIRVSVTEIESAAHRIPRVRAAAVVPAKDPLGGAALVAVTDAQPHEVLEALREFLPGSKMPARCLVVDDLPKTGRGKIDRSALAEVVRSA